MRTIDFNPTPKQLAGIKATLFLLCLLPLAILIRNGAYQELGANPIEAVIRNLGDWALYFLLIGLAVTPLRRLTGLHWILRLRRMLGLYAFFYAALHVAAYIGIDQFFDWAAIVDDILQRPFITVGFAAFLLLVPLAATSTNAMIRRLGGANWQRLHRLVYPAAILAVLHYFWMVKLDVREPLFFAALLAMLLGVRLWWRWQSGGFRPRRNPCQGQAFPELKPRLSENSTDHPPGRKP